MLFPALDQAKDTAADAEAIRFGEQRLTYRDVTSATSALAADLPPRQTRVAIWAVKGVETVLASVAALRAGVPAVPVNPAVGERELTHILTDSAPEAILCAPDVELPAECAGLRRIDVTTDHAPAPAPAARLADDDPGLVVYTSGTTGPPKGVVLSRGAIAATLDALADAWQWTADDVVVHALPLFHVHGLILGMLGPLRRGGTAHHIGRFDPHSLGEAITAHPGRQVVTFGVPTMYHRLAQAMASDADLAATISTARLLISGSAPLPVRDHEHITAACGQQVIERYGMTETLMNTSVRVDGPRRPGTVGVALPGMRLRIVDEDGVPIETRDDETIGEIQVRGASLFSGYLNRPDATAESFDGDWFRTGDMATMDADGFVRIVGRKATDLIKCGGYKIGAGEIENALLEHPHVAEVAVTSEPDADLGERIVAWVVANGEPDAMAGTGGAEGQPSATELTEHVGRLLASHKRPHEVRFVDSLPRNELGKVTKRSLHAPGA
ncbi:acyl-CoA synthetase [Haloechinothrix halophila]|uniref:Acyl-CoA synthetase (AMP-forming)/AMP-acid ligase II n=1 Tax=Haloechinothrix halophila YIM 93223 TaxID=592678 RepID=W9DN72_9PSEU|nr:acyl-CoA synthetase [Haloechinothrix halophila]ETA66348.1 acyl-CoA synthetase (AMP-forming)/AMP-acid ligase II [Haloechinothrix halophila YIM 93223]